MKKISILALCMGLWAQEIELMISYKVKMQNDLLVGEEYRVSEVIDPKGMRGVREGKYRVHKVCTFLGEDENIKKVLKLQKDAVLDCLYSSGVKIYDEVNTQNSQAQSKTILAILPRRVIAASENGVIHLKILEEVEKKQ